MKLLSVLINQWLKFIVIIRQKRSYLVYLLKISVDRLEINPLVKDVAIIT